MEVCKEPFFYTHGRSTPGRPRVRSWREQLIVGHRRSKPRWPGLARWSQRLVFMAGRSSPSPSAWLGGSGSRPSVRRRRRRTRSSLQGKPKQISRWHLGLWDISGKRICTGCFAQTYNGLGGRFFAKFLVQVEDSSRAHVLDPTVHI
jgi:hypothetical protein